MYIGDCGVCVVGKMLKDIVMGVCKGILWCRLFLPCLVTFWGFHPYMSFHFLFCDLFPLFFFGGGQGYRAILTPDAHV